MNTNDLRADIEALADEWNLTRFPHEPTATTMRHDLRAVLARHAAEPGKPADSLAGRLAAIRAETTS